MSASSPWVCLSFLMIKSSKDFFFFICLIYFDTNWNSFKASIVPIILVDKSGNNKLNNTIDDDSKQESIIKSHNCSSYCASYKIRHLTL
ncbi:protein of unknown function [Candidatus Nitrosocosmicus franklandus]|uniref:Uncharacterized protein n=1 Tax=Candidatus Nitrosocosmicus franklandianus TaxID=1798806 RepID=A0A484IBV5_9ARCH|nr:protein of unknown function [Candidatus Nitrosocosmicus franklandus]